MTPGLTMPNDNLAVETFHLDGQICSVYTPVSKIKSSQKKFLWPEIVADLLSGTGLDERAARSGRGGIFFFSDSRSPESIVVRQYRHGGLWRLLSGARFFSEGRFLSELKIHNQVSEIGVLVPQAVAVIVVKEESKPIFVNGYFVTLMLQGSFTLPEFLESAEAKTRLAIFFRIGDYLKKLHEHGIFYTDMHVKNILLTSAGEPCFIDFDKAKECPAPLPDRLRHKNLKRFLRSLEKYSSRGGRLTESDRAAFLLAYASDSQTYAKLFQKFGRALFWRSLVYRLGWLINRS